MIASDDPPPPSSLRSRLPVDLERAGLACLVKNPARRATLVDLARALGKYAPERGRASLERIEAVAAAGEPRARAPGRGPLAFLLLLAAAVLAVRVVHGTGSRVRGLCEQVASATSAVAGSWSPRCPRPRHPSAMAPPPRRAEPNPPRRLFQAPSGPRHRRCLPRRPRISLLFPRPIRRLRRPYPRNMVPSPGTEARSGRSTVRSCA